MDIYAGLSGLELSEPTFDLGHGVTIRQTYAHLFAPFLLAFSHAETGKPHPGPWKAARGGLARDITSEIHVPLNDVSVHSTTQAAAWAIVFTLRLGVDPATELAVLSNRPLSREGTSEGEDAWILPIEVESKRFPLSIEGGVLDRDRAQWVASRWPTALRLINDHAEFAIAVDAVMTGQYVHRAALTLVALWAALEAMFSPSTAELRFRVSSLIAAYLEPPGASRRKRARDVSKLYDKRSSAAHGKPDHGTEHLLATFNLLREVLLKVLEAQRIPTREDLEGLLYGGT